MSEERKMAVKALDDRTQKYLQFLSQAVGGYRGLCEMMDAQLNRNDVRIERLEAANAELLKALECLVEINRLDKTADPSWRNRAWRNAKNVIAKETG